MKKLLKERLIEHNDVFTKMAEDAAFIESVGKAGEMAVSTFKGGGRILLCGNGGSAADAQHIAAELVGRFKAERAPLPAMALTVNTSSLTAIGNDYGYDEVFSRQVEAFGAKGDVLIGISTSGNSPNVIKAILKAKETGISAIGMTGNRPGTEIEKASDVCIQAPSDDTPRIQEAHIFIGHLICEYVENELFK
ncbi:MAG: D-sedoheptulose 7-phosphate isomerase [Nitrospinota bacterium]